MACDSTVYNIQVVRLIISYLQKCSIEIFKNGKRRDEKRREKKIIEEKRKKEMRREEKKRRDVLSKLQKWATGCKRFNSKSLV
jgi:hypothetical protein